MVGENSGRELHVWVLTDGAAGHESQSIGIVDAISSRYVVSFSKVSLTVRRRYLKSITRALLALRVPLSLRFMRAIYDIHLPRRQPDFIVSSGGNTLLASAIIARHFNVPNFYSGTLKGYPTREYSVIFTLVPQGMANNVVLPLAPMPKKILDAARSPVRDFAVMLIGGATKEYPFSTMDYQSIAKGMMDFSHRTGIKWLFSTSRRTGAEAERAFQDVLSVETVEDMVLWQSAPRKVVSSFLRRSACVFCTEDSMTMIVEAVWSGRPVISIGLEHAKPSGHDLEVLLALEAGGFLQRITCAEFSAGRQVHIGGGGGLPPVPQMIVDAVSSFLKEKG